MGAGGLAGAGASGDESALSVINLYEEDDELSLIRQHLSHAPRSSILPLLSKSTSNHKDNQMHNCEDGDENESVSLDAALSAASKNQAGITKVGNTKENSTTMVEIPKNSVNLKQELKAETEEEDQIKPKKLGTISLSTVFSSEDSDSEVEVKKKKISNKSKLVQDSSSSEDSEVEVNRKKSNK